MTFEERLREADWFMILVRRYGGILQAAEALRPKPLQVIDDSIVRALFADQNPKSLTPVL